MNLAKNVGTIDKLIRIPLGIVIIAAGLYYNSFLGLIGVIPLVSALSGFCPLYAVFGFSTYNNSPTRQNEQPVK